MQSMVESSLSYASSVRDYLYENGRRYHAYRQGKYPLPNDEREQDRLDLVHHLWKEILNGGLYRAPISPSDTYRILDFGTGTGNWALDMAESFPHAEIVGTDLSPIQPVWFPPNCKFYVDDVESEWIYLPQEAFDYIHGRVIGGSISDWGRLLSQVHAHLKPGGWVEFQEFESKVWSDDDTHRRVEALHDWTRKLDDASSRFGKPVDVTGTLAQKLRDAGFVDVTDDVYKVS
jgi:trans-aconitate methyltransferase